MPSPADGAREYSMEVVERAEELYCVDGQTFEAVATLTGVAASTLKRWSERYGWQDKKEQIRQAMSSIRTNTIRLRARLLENCLTTLKSQDAFAVSAIEGLALRAAAQKTDPVLKAESISSPPREIKTDEDAVAALEEAVSIKVASMLSDPGRITGAAVKEIAQIRATIEDLKKAASGKTSAESGKRSGLSADAAEQLRRDILGIAR